MKVRRISRPRLRPPKCTGLSHFTFLFFKGRQEMLRSRVHVYSHSFTDERFFWGRSRCCSRHTLLKVSTSAITAHLSLFPSLSLSLALSLSSCFCRCRCDGCCPVAVVVAVNVNATCHSDNVSFADMSKALSLYENAQ